MKNNIKYFDVHSHLHSSFFNSREDGQKVAEQMKEQGIHSVIIGVDLADSKKAVKMAEKNENLYCSIGIHPVDDDKCQWDEKEFQNLLFNDIENKLLDIFNKNKNKTICVVATTSTGKSTLIRNIGVGIDMDDIIFSKLNKEEKEYVCGDWDRSVAEFMEKKTKEYIKPCKGGPVFGTIVFDTDIVIYIDIDDEVLINRTKKRDVDFNTSLEMKKWIEERVRQFTGEKFFLKIKKNEKIVCVGECGLDYFWPNKDLKSGKITSKDFEKEKKRQKDLFESQIDFAVKNDLPLMLHIRSFENADAHWNAFEILDKKQSEHSGKIRADFHFFTEGPEIVREVVKRNFMISLPGVITFADFDSTVTEIPIENLMIETDSPFAAPKPFRGKTNTPVYVKEVAKKVAEIKNMREEEVAEQTTKNALKFFDIK